MIAPQPAAPPLQLQTGVPSAPSLPARSLTLEEALQAIGDRAEVAEMRQLQEEGYHRLHIVILGAPPSHSELMYSRYEKLRRPMEEKLIAGLLDGSLIAWGYVSGSGPNDRPMRIRADRWRLLKPNFEESSAAGSGLEIYGIRVSTAGTRAQRNGTDRRWLITIDEAISAVGVDGRDIPLRGRLFSMFLALAKSAAIGDGRYIENRALSPGLGKDATTKAIERLRKTFKEAGVSQRAVDALFENERGKGYRLNQARFEIRIAGVSHRN